MSCSRCEALEEENAFLRSELGMIRDATHIAALRQAYGVTGAAAEILAILYRAQGRVLTRYQIAEQLPVRSEREKERDPKVVDVHLVRIRRRVGADTIDSVWGRGWKLSEAGQARVKAVLEPVERAA